MKREFNCHQCGVPVFRTPGQVVGRVFCSRSCTGKALTGQPSRRRKMVGPSHSQWKGGRIVKPSGYVCVWRPDHANADAWGYIPEHRLVMSELLGRPLLRTEHVHHINRDKQDNRPENLVILSHSDHSTLHHAENRVHWSRLHRACVVCHTTERKHYAKGMCHRCLMREWMRAGRAAGYIAPSRRKVTSEHP